MRDLGRANPVLTLAVAELRHRPGRAAFLLAGYALGVAVMVVLLAVGEAMLTQARDATLIGGGDLVVVPAGISPELLKAGGATSLFLGIDQARFIHRSVLESRRGADEYGIVAASPLLDAKLVELTTPAGSFAAVATGEIPSRARAAGAAAPLLAGAWEDTDADRRWVAPSPQELYREIDRFHLPAGEALDSTWAEWHYFNIAVSDRRWLYITFMIAGEVGVPGRWGGRILLTTRDADGTYRSFTRDVEADLVRFDTTSPDLSIGGAGSVRLEGGVYRVRAELEGRSIDVSVVPSAGRYFPPADLGGTELISGYVVPALAANATGTLCLPACEEVRDAPAYHDHNWGVWRNVSWEWGAASGAHSSLLYGLVRGDQDDHASGRALFAYLVDEHGVRGLYRPSPPRTERTRALRIDGRTIQVPERFSFEDPRRGFRVEVDVESARATDLERPRARYFIQMRGVARVRVGGGAEEALPGFFETYVDE
jgi:hypothetical protein